MLDPLIVLLLSFGLQWETGHAAYYAEGVMEQVVAVRLAGWTAGTLTDEDVRGVVGFIATPYCEEIGDRVWLFHESEGWRGPYLVADCCNQVEGHCKAMLRNNIVVEVGFNTAKRWGVLGFGPRYIEVTVARTDE